MTKGEREHDLGERVPARQPNRAAAQRPVEALIGLAVGIVLAFLIGLIFWPAAPVVTLIAGFALRIGDRTAAVGTGLQAAACGIAAFLFALAIVFSIL